MSMGRRSVQESYSYKRLVDAVVCVNEKLNFYGVVAEYEQPKPTRGKDYICTMTVTDMSCNSSGVRVLYFAPALEMLPRVHALGDIIRFHRITMKSYEDAPQAQGHPNKGSSFVLLRGLEADGYEPYQKSHSNFTMESHDRDIINLLRTWIVTHPFDAGGAAAGTNKYLISIKDMKEGSYFDLCCKILFVNNQVAENSVIIHVWDGTDASPVNSAPLQSGDPDEDLWSCKELAVPINVMRDFPGLGTVLALVPDMPADELLPQLPVAGDWVKLRNIVCRVQKGFYEGVFLRESKISILSPSSQLVQNCAAAYIERLASEEMRLPQWCPRPPQSILVTSYEHVRLSTLREVLTHSQVTYKFRCMVRIIATCPSEVVDFCAPIDQASTNQEDGQQQKAYVYTVRLTLEDPTAHLHALLYGEDAVEFFVGYPAADLCQQGDTVGVLKRKVNRLLGLQDPGSPNPPWVKCCLMSYYTDKEHPKESRRFRIFSTRLPG